MAAICERYVELALAQAGLSEVTALAIDQTPCRRSHNYLKLAADADERKALFVAERRGAQAVGDLVTHLRTH